MFVRTPSLLITDDDDAFRETLQEVFEPLGFQTLLARDGAEALEIIRTRVVDIAVFDMHMPRLTGLEALQQVKAIKALLPCILLSADLTDGLVELARRADAFSVLSKPVTTRQITGIVQTALEWTYNRHAGRP